MKSVIQWAIRNTPAMNMLTVAVIVLGVISVFSLRREMFPEFELEVILVSVPYPGASPEEVEEGICRKIEEGVRSLDGIKKVTSVAAEGAGSVILELFSDVEDVQKVLNEVRSEIDRIPSFPELAEDPEIKQITMRQPAIRVGILGPETDSPDAELKLREVAEEVRDELLMLPNVSQANLIGVKDYQIDIEMSEATLRKYGLTLQEVARLVRRENVELPGGNLKTDGQEVLLRGKNKRSVGEDIAKLPIVTQSNGVVLSVGDLGTVRDEFVDVDSTSRINGRPGLAISIDRTADEDLLKIADEVKEYVAKKADKLPDGFELIDWGDASLEVRGRLNLMVNNGLQGLVLVFITLALFLEFRLAFWVAWGIPVSLLGTCAAMYFLGHSINMLTTFGFLMTLGIEVDDCIVISENIHEHRQRGKSALRAAIDGTAEVFPSVLSSVLTTIVAFLPLMYVSGMMGKFVAVLPVACILILLISLVEATLILPCHLSHEGHGGGLRGFNQRLKSSLYRLPIPVRFFLGWPAWAVLYFLEQLTYPIRQIARMFNWLSMHCTTWLDWGIAKFHRPALSWTISHPALVISSCFAFLMVATGLIRAGVVPWSIMPKMDSNELSVAVTYPDGTPASITNQAVDRLEKAIMEVNERHATEGKPLVLYSHAAVGYREADRGPGGSAMGPAASGGHAGSIRVELVDSTERTVPSFQVINEWREAAGEFPGAETVRFSGGDNGPGGRAIEFKLLTSDGEFEDLEAAVEQCKAKLAEYPGVFDISDDSSPGKWEFQINVKEEAVAMGLTAADLAETVRAAYYGEEVMRLQRGRHEVKLMVRYPREERRSLANFDNLYVRAGDGAERPITALADLRVARGPSEINRVDQMRSITVSADLDESLANASEIVGDLQATFIPALLTEHPDVHVRWEGQKEQTDESLQSLFKGLIVAIFAMFVMLTIEFRSYLQPLLILLVIPFGIVGGIAGHAFLDMPMTLFSVFGLVTLTGVVVNDAIVLIDFINERMRHGLPVKQALLEAGSRRVRPVLLTSITTIAGVLPLITERSLQAQIVIPMAVSLCFGLMFTTVLVLYFVPVLYYVYWRMTEIFAASSTHEPDDEDLPQTKPTKEQLLDSTYVDELDEPVEVATSSRP